MRLTLLLLILASCGNVCAQSDGVFTPPNAYPVSRYEAGWNKNPFTLKTAPVLQESASFSKDLAIGTYYGDSADPTVVLVNTKTHERIRLRKGQPAANGMKLGQVKLGGSRKDISAEVTLGAETSQIHYDDAYLKQVAASEGAKAPQGQQQQARLPGMPPNAQAPGQQMKIPLPAGPGGPGGRPPGVASNSSAPMNGPMGGPGNFGRPANAAAPSLSSSNTSASPSPSSVSSSSPVAQLVPERRRLITPAGN